MATDDHDPAAHPAPPPAPATDGRPRADARPATDGRTAAPSSAPTTGARTPRDVNRTGVVVAVVVAAVVLVALVAIVLRRDPVQLDLATPEGTVQAFLQSVVDGQPRDDLLDPTVDCEAPPSRGDEDRIRAVVLNSTIDGDRATVDLSVTESSGSGPFDDGYTQEVGYELRRDGDGWVIAAYDWPRSSRGEFCWNDRMGLGS